MRAAVLASLAVLVVARPAGAIPYETFIDVTDQSELEDLLAAQDISQDTYDELLDLLERGVDLNTAQRSELYALPNLTYDDVDKIIAYRSLQKGVIRDPAELVSAGALSEEKLLAIAGFLLVRPPGESPIALHGWVRGMTRVSHKDRIAPPFLLRGRFHAARHLQAGFGMTTTRLRVGAPVFDPNRNALISERRSLEVHVPKAFVKWETDEFALIAGSYRAGFAQRLVFDNSSQYTPNGLYSDDQLFYAVDLDRDCRESTGELEASPCTGARGSKYVTPDFSWRNGLLGVGAGVKKLELPTGWLQAFAWASASKRSIYQYELVVRDGTSATCRDPHDDDDPLCAAPTVFVRPDGNLLTPTSQLSFVTLPDVFLEKLAGGNVSYYADRRNSVGVTAYGATETNLVDGVALDFQEWSRYPTGRTFGAAGANFSFGQRWLDVFGEAALSYDKSPESAPSTGGGGPAGILRVTATRRKEELEAVFRYYGIDYANPYARPISQADEFDGQRARDELGARLRYLNTGKRFTLRALLDVWVPPSTMRDDFVLGRATPKLDTYVRADVRTTDELRLGLWLRYQDKDLAEGGHDQCFEVSTETSPTGDPIPCAGRQLTTIARAHYQADRTLGMTFMLQHQLLDDDKASMTAFRSDVAAWAIGTWVPNKDFRVRTRLRYLDEAIADNTYLERSFSGLVDASFKLRDRDILRVRMDTKFWLDDRASTQERSPNPELQL
ncbi:MAG: hypothetical protein JWP01_360, partial [Myxococcales bacterium]|nr:hypothetical protein [Myxococcales bacterium]